MSNMPTETELCGFSLSAPVWADELEFSGEAQVEEMYATMAADNLRWSGCGPVVFCSIEWEDASGRFRPDHKSIRVRVWGRKESAL